MTITWENVKRGDVIPVYEDPLTQTKLEGEAIVVEVHSRDQYSGTNCTVKFGDGFVVRRRVLAEPTWLAPEDKPKVSQ